MHRGNDPAKYYRTSIAIPQRYEEKLKARLAETGMETVGDLVNLFLHLDGMPALLAPLQVQLREQQAAQKSAQALARATAARLGTVASESGLTPEEAKQALLEAAQRKKVVTT
jgi:hypothetical protein